MIKSEVRVRYDVESSLYGPSVLIVDHATLSVIIHNNYTLLGNYRINSL